MAPGLRPHLKDIKRRLAEGREKLRQRHSAGSPGVQVCAATSDLLDSLVLDLFDEATADSTLPGKVALVAHGGYGRRDVAPYSDVDLMILYAAGAERQVAPLAKQLMQDLFDVGLQLGQSVRTPRDACVLAIKDAAIFTSLVESRYLAGSITLYKRYAERFGKVARKRARPLVAAIEQARGEERRQYGETVYLLEPNIKRSPGGLRGVQLLRWVGFARYGVSQPDSLRLCGALGSADYRVVRDAAEYLLRLRNEMHFHAGKPHDVVDRVEQLRLAAWLDFQGDGGMLPVEQFMREYFRHTHGIANVVRRFVASMRGRSRVAATLGPLLSHQVEGDFRVGPMHISATRRGLTKIKQDLAEVLRLADLANLYDKHIEHSTSEAIRAAAASLPDEVSPQAGTRFLSLLEHPPRLGELLRGLHELGVLEKIIPAFTHARCLLQFNEYHKYTVDEHCLRAVEAAAQWAHDPGPLGQAYQRIKQKRTLHLALLLHDLGKGFAEDHCERGVKIVEETARRLCLGEDETEKLKFLVQHHLMMSHLAFRRDTSDEQVVVQLAVDAGSPEVMRMLYVLTAADLAAVGPGVLNSWKIDVLNSLYERAMTHLAGEGATQFSQERFEQLRQAVRRLLEGDVEKTWLYQQVACLPSGYLLARSPQEIAGTLRNLHQLPRGDSLARGCWQQESGTVEYTIGTYEEATPGVFHKLTGVLASQGLEILTAEICTLADGLIIDRFIVSDPDYAGESPPERIESVVRALRESLSSGAETQPAFRKVWRAAGDRRAVELIPPRTRVRVDNNSSDTCTILDIFTTDRRGLLYTISKTLYDLGLSVSVAKIGTYLDQVVDVFYVTDAQGAKIQNEEELQRIRERLIAVVEAFDEQTAAT